MYRIKKLITESINTKQQLLQDENLLHTILRVVELTIEAFRAGNKVLLFGNGGSAADAQHIAAELSGRFYIDRKALYAEALHCNTSYLTAVANDYSYKEAYARLLDGMGRKGDIAIGLSTSGNSENMIKAVETAAAKEMTVIGMTGAGGGKMKELCHYLINVPSQNTPRIQEMHILCGHIICELVEAELFGKGNN